MKGSKKQKRQTTENKTADLNNTYTAKTVLKIQEIQGLCEATQYSTITEMHKKE